MKLLFDRNEAGEIVTLLDNKGEISEFRYTTFVQNIFEEGSLESVEFTEKITSDEKASLEKMLSEINSTIKRMAAEPTQADTSV